jgi:hypothetical protein
MSSVQHDLPYLDEHVLLVAAPVTRVWAALEEVAASLGVPDSRLGVLMAAVLGTRPVRGFAVSAREPETSLVLSGRHRCSRYQLSFDLGGTPDGRTRLRATSHAAFPGVRGGIYRGVVIRSGAHLVSVRHILQTIARRAAAGRS